LAIFDKVHSRTHDAEVILYAFDLLELGGQDWRPRTLEERKERLERLLAKAPVGVHYTEHLEGDGAAIFAHACRLGAEGIVSKHREHPYRSGPSKARPRTRRRPACCGSGTSHDRKTRLSRRRAPLRLLKAPRGKHPGRRVDRPVESEAEHFIRCPNCGVLLDLRDLGQVLEHDTPPTPYRGPPVTLGHMRSHECRRLLILLLRSLHSATVEADRWPDETAVRDLRRKAVCTKCGMKGADVRPDWSDRPQPESLTGAQWR
jgi:hypothetical protein